MTTANKSSSLWSSALAAPSVLARRLKPSWPPVVNRRAAVFYMSLGTGITIGAVLFVLAAPCVALGVSDVWATIMPFYLGLSACLIIQELGFFLPNLVWRQPWHRPLRAEGESGPSWWFLVPFRLVIRVQLPTINVLGFWFLLWSYSRRPGDAVLGFEETVGTMIVLPLIGFSVGKLGLRYVPSFFDAKAWPTTSELPPPARRADAPLSTKSGIPKAATAPSRATSTETKASPPMETEACRALGHRWCFLAAGHTGPCHVRIFGTWIEDQGGSCYTPRAVAAFHERLFARGERAMIDAYVDGLILRLAELAADPETRVAAIGREHVQAVLTGLHTVNHYDTAPLRAMVAYLSRRGQWEHRVCYCPSSDERRHAAPS